MLTPGFFTGAVLNDTPPNGGIELGFVEAVKNGVVRGSEMLFLKGKGRGR